MQPYRVQPTRAFYPRPLTHLTTGLLAAGMLAATTANAASDQALLHTLRKKGVLTQQEYNKLRAAHKKKSKHKKAAAARKTKGQSSGSALVFNRQGGLRYKTPNSKYAFQVGGRVQADGTIYDEDKASLGSGAEIRRGRLFAKGVLYYNWAFKAQFDFAGSGNAIRDLYLSYIGIDNSAITAGNFKEPFSLENKTSSKYITFTERALPVDAFRPGRRIGLSFATYGKRWHVAAGGFGNKVSGSPQVGANGKEHDSGWSVAGRATFDPIYSKSRLLHVGGSFEYRSPSGVETVRFRDRPESHVTNVRLVDTGAIQNVNDFQLYDFESAAVAGPLSVQGEYLYNNVDRSGENVSFHGWYVHASWFLTGESRASKYSPSSAFFDRLTPRHAWGAVQVALRYSTLDLDSGPVRGGKEDDITVGVNWYVNAYVRLSANYVNVVDQHRQGVSDQPQSVQLRAQVDF